MEFAKKCILSIVAEERKDPSKQKELSQRRAKKGYVYRMQEKTEMYGRSEASGANRRYPYRNPT